MRIIDLIEYLIEPKRLRELLDKFNINEESEAILIYMKDALDIHSEISLFEIEETEDDLYFTKDNVQYIQLFPVDYAIDLIESDLYLKAKGFSMEEIGKRLLEYRLRDA